MGVRGESCGKVGDPECTAVSPVTDSWTKQLYRPEKKDNDAVITPLKTHYTRTCTAKKICYLEGALSKKMKPTYV